MSIEIFIRNVYGNELIYPANDTAKLLTELTGTKTFSLHHIDTFHRLGYTVTITHGSMPVWLAKQIERYTKK